ncbi:MAG: DUF4091 domain-containing protein [Phycisphaerae bacterium]|nr:DUF4091 domain-containing protein [Phycisphaerae bacterium]
MNERFSFQIAMQMAGEQPQQVRLEVDSPRGLMAQIRRVGYVPIRHHNVPVMPDSADMEGLGHIPGYVPDPLYEEDSMLLPAGETHAFWITVRPSRNALPGRHTIKVTVIPETGRRKTHTVRVRLHDIVLRKRKNFTITNWFYSDSLMDWYKTDGFDKRFWEILPRYMRNLADHGLDTVYVPVFTPPLDGIKRPSQLLRVKKVQKDQYRFDWRDVRKYINHAKSCGITHFEWPHPFTQWGVKHAIRIYKDQGQNGELLWPAHTGATSKTYRIFLAQYLPQLHRFLAKENILKKSFFHVSDEPHNDKDRANYRKARTMLGELAPWMKVMDCMTDISLARQGLTDVPIASIRTALDFVAEDIPSWCYYCCGPREAFLNRLIDTPLAKIAMHGLLFYRWPFKGFLHWGYNYWYKSQTRDLIDPYTVQDALAWPHWAYGDPFMVYPGPDGPVDSVRWEIFGESLQDYALLQTLGVDRNNKLLAPLKSFENFPKTERWRRDLRAKLFAEAKKKTKKNSR